MFFFFYYNQSGFAEFRAVVCMRYADCFTVVIEGIVYFLFIIYYKRICFQCRMFYLCYLIHYVVLGCEKTCGHSTESPEIQGEFKG